MAGGRLLTEIDQGVLLALLLNLSGPQKCTFQTSDDRLVADDRLSCFFAPLHLWQSQFVASCCARTLAWVWILLWFLDFYFYYLPVQVGSHGAVLCLRLFFLICSWCTAGGVSAHHSGPFVLWPVALWCFSCRCLFGSAVLAFGLGASLPRLKVGSSCEWWTSARPHSGTFYLSCSGGTTAFRTVVLLLLLHFWLLDELLLQ